MTGSTRRAVISAGAACSAPMLFGFPAEARAAKVVIKTSAGPVEGLRQAGVSAFKGIPYGEATSGRGRFRPPRPVRAWRGLRQAVADPPQAPQRDPRQRRSAPVRSPYAGIEPDWAVLPESEDCLRLNVWTPALKGEGKRPVIVWFHGGGFAVGSAAGAWQDGANLCRAGDVIFVSVNHRLNALGHLYIDALDPAFAGAGNAGLSDLVLALRWVHENIAAFGGDPGNVTIAGQSGGGQKVSMLMAAPQAAGLYHKAIVESGPAPKALEPAYAAEMAERLIGKLGIGRRELGKLQALPLESIMRSYYEVFEETGGYGVLGVLQGFAPVVDGMVLPNHPFAPTAPAVSAAIPLIIGSTRTEMSLGALQSDPTAYRMDEAGALVRLAPLFGADAGKVLAGYRTAHPAVSWWELYTLITADWPTRIYSIEIAERKAALRGAPVYMYRTDWRTPVAGGRLMSPHAIDLSLALGDEDADTAFNGGGPRPRAMSQKISGAWLAFAHTGNPDTPLCPQWPAYDPANGRITMIFDDEPRIERDPDGEDRKLIASLKS